MRSHNHLITGTFISTVVLTTDIHLLKSSNETVVHVGEVIKDFFIPKTLTTPVLMILYIVAGVLLIWLGTIFPDCDQHTSMVGRVIHIPVAHRTWTHAVWIPTMFLIASYWVPILRWFVLGYIEHIWCDSLSVGGICWLYPITRYKQTGSGRYKRHLCMFYHTGEITETIVMVLICVVCGIADYLLIFGDNSPVEYITKSLAQSI